MSKEAIQCLGRIHEGQTVPEQDIKAAQIEFRNSRLGKEIAPLFAARRYAMPTLTNLNTVARKIQCFAHCPAEWANFPHKEEKPLKLAEIKNMMTTFAQKPRNFFALRKDLFQKMRLAPAFTKVLFDFNLMPESIARMPQEVTPASTMSPKSAMNNEDHADVVVESAAFSSIGCRDDEKHANESATGSSVECSGSNIPITVSDKASSVDTEEGVCACT